MIRNNAYLQKSIILKLVFNTNCRQLRLTSWSEHKKCKKTLYKYKIM